MNFWTNQIINKSNLVQPWLCAFVSSDNDFLFAVGTHTISLMHKGHLSEIDDLG